MTQGEPAEQTSASQNAPAAGDAKSNTSLEPGFSNPARTLLLGMLVLLFFSAFVVGRVIAPALLGWRSGIEHLIRQADVGAAVLGQLALITGVVVAVEYLYVAVRSSELHIGFRLAIAPLTAGMVTLSLAAGARDLPLFLVVVLVVLVTLLAMSASITMLASPHTRAAGAVLGTTAVAAFLELTARILAVRASQDALTGLFRAAQVVATLSFLAEVIALGIAALWLASRRWITLAIVGSVVWLTSGFLAWSAIVGASYGASAWQVLVNRAVMELARNPWPLLPSWLYFTLEIAALLSVPVALLGRRAQPVCRSAIALALLCRGDADLPIVALALALGALIGSVAAAREVPPSPAPASAAPLLPAMG